MRYADYCLCQWSVVWLLLIVAVCLEVAQCSEIALFAFFSCYGHDTVMQEAGMELHGNRTTWIQLKLYDMRGSVRKLPESWSQLVSDQRDEEGNRVITSGGRVLWEMSAPVDFQRFWDPRALVAMNAMMRRNMHGCAEIVRSREFARLRAEHTFDLVVVDHHPLQSCVAGMASLLNATTVSYSNWPISDYYSESMNIPANPSSAGRSSSPLSSLRLTFLERVLNTLYYIVIAIVKKMQDIGVREEFRRLIRTEVDLRRVESEHLFYAGRSELLTEVTRPVTNRIKYFGEPFAVDKSAYVIRERPHGWRPNASLCSKYEEEYRRYEEVGLKHPEFDLKILEKGKFIAISFGSIVQTELMPASVLSIFLETFGNLSYSVIWATNSDPKVFMCNRTTPPNVFLLPWVPLKHLLAHRNVLYFITHGGINSVNEMLTFGVPAIGLPFLGDQLTNVQRLVDLGVGIATSISDVRYGGMAKAIRRMEGNLARYSQRAKEIAGMVVDIRQHNTGGRRFWLHWAQRHGNQVRHCGRRYFHFEYRNHIERFAIPQIFSASAFALSLFYLLSL